MMRPNIIKLFILLWVVFSMLSSAYIGLKIFPQEYKKLTGAVVEVYFQTEITKKIIYRPNVKKYRKKYLKDLSDNLTVYFDACALLKYDIKITCDNTTNWKKIYLDKINCSEVRDCIEDKFILSREERYDTLIDLVKSNGLDDNERLVKRIKSGDPATKEDIDLKNPITWGDTEISKWAVFMLLLFFFIKVGRAAGEFLFLPYEQKT